MPSWIIVCVVILVICCLGFIGNPDRKTKLKLDDLLSGRPDRSDQDYHAEFYEGSNVTEHIVSKVRHIFSEQIGVDLKALEPDDDFSEDYSLIWALDSMADVEIVVSLEEEFGIKISDGEAASMKSIRSISEIVSAKLNEKNFG